MWDKQVNFFSFRCEVCRITEITYRRSEATMRFSAVAVALLNLLSVGLSVPVIDCGTLTRPIDIENREQVRLISIDHF